MGKRGTIGERDWGKKPLFGPRRRSRGRWLLLLLLLLAAALLLLFPDIVSALLAPVLG